MSSNPPHPLHSNSVIASSLSIIPPTVGLIHSSSLNNLPNKNSKINYSNNIITNNNSISNINNNNNNSNPRKSSPLISTRNEILESCTLLDHSIELLTQSKDESEEKLDKNQLIKDLQIVLSTLESLRNSPYIRSNFLQNSFYNELTALRRESSADPNELDIVDWITNEYSNNKSPNNRRRRSSLGSTTSQDSTRSLNFDNNNSLSMNTHSNSNNNNNISNLNKSNTQLINIMESPDEKDNNNNRNSLESNLSDDNELELDLLSPTITRASDYLARLSSAHNNNNNFHHSVGNINQNDKNIKSMNNNENSAGSDSSLTKFKQISNAVRFITRIQKTISNNSAKASLTLESNYRYIVEKSITDPVKACLSKINNWKEFDIFELAQYAEDRILSVLTLYLFEELNIFESFSIPRHVFGNFMRCIEEGYLDNPYHNRIHAADVTASTYWFLTRDSFSDKITSADIFSGLVASAIHDYNHPGTNNSFQVSTQSDYALRYNDRTVLESMHCAEAFFLMKRNNHDILASFLPADRKEVRETIITMVLSTDLSVHFKNLAQLKSSIERKKSSNTLFLHTEPADRLLLLETALHAADLGNPSKPFNIYSEWTNRINEEFYAQGDKERSLGLPISAMMDRTKANTEKSQCKFIDLIVRPLYQTFQEVVTEVSQCLENIENNYNYWADRLPPQTPNTSIIINNNNGTNINNENNNKDTLNRTVSNNPLISPLLTIRQPSS